MLWGRMALKKLTTRFRPRIYYEKALKRISRIKVTAK